MTIDVVDSELLNFSNLAARWWDTEGPCKALHQLNPTRLHYVLSNSNVANAKVLDVGCGGGILAESMAANGAKVTGIDPSKELIETAKQHVGLSSLSVNYVNASAATFAAEGNGGFDIVTCMELLEHVPCPIQLLKACKSLLKPGGILFFSTLNRTFRSYALAIIGAEYILRLLPVKTHDFQKFIKPSELDSWLRQVELDLADLTGITYNPILGNSSLTDNVAVNYIGFAVNKETLQ